MIDYSKSAGRMFPGVCTLAFLMVMSGCATVRQPPAQPPSAEEHRFPAQAEPASDPRSLASLQLTGQGRMLLEQRRYDDAIRMLERAIALQPMNGENYYYLAEAWLAKNRLQQAEEFNRLAEMYLESSRWAERVLEQRRAISAKRTDQ
jgi:tetratricopeptide (TPR) repeat protein